MSLFYLCRVGLIEGSQILQGVDNKTSFGIPGDNSSAACDMIRSEFIYKAVRFTLKYLKTVGDMAENISCETIYPSPYKTWQAMTKRFLPVKRQ